MNNLLAFISANAAEGIAIAWLAALTVLMPKAIMFYFATKKQIQEGEAESKRNSARLDVHDQTANVNSAAIVASQAPAPATPINPAPAVQSSRIP